MMPIIRRVCLFVLVMTAVVFAWVTPASALSPEEQQYIDFVATHLKSGKYVFQDTGSPPPMQISEAQTAELTTMADSPAPKVFVAIVNYEKVKGVKVGDLPAHIGVSLKQPGIVLVATQTVDPPNPPPNTPTKLKNTIVAGAFGDTIPKEIKDQVNDPKDGLATRTLNNAISAKNTAPFEIYKQFIASVRSIPVASTSEATSPAVSVTLGGSSMGPQVVGAVAVGALLMVLVVWRTKRQKPTAPQVEAPVHTPMITGEVVMPSTPPTAPTPAVTSTEAVPIVPESMDVSSTDTSGTTPAVAPAEPQAAIPAAPATPALPAASAGPFPAAPAMLPALPSVPKARGRRARQDNEYRRYWHELRARLVSFYAAELTPTFNAARNVPAAQGYCNAAALSFQYAQDRLRSPNNDTPPSHEVLDAAQVHFLACVEAVNTAKSIISRVQHGLPPGA